MNPPDSRFKVRHFGALQSRAFTLMELLVTIGIVSILVMAAIPAVQSLGSADRFNRNIAHIRDTLEGAHATAVAKNTYVWVGLQPLPDGETVALVAAASRRGRAGDLLNREISQVGQTVLLHNAQLSSIPQTDVPAPGRSSNGVAQLMGADLEPGTTADQMTLRVGETDQTFTNLLQISPSGEVRASSDRMAWVEIGLLPAPSVNQQKAVIQMSGFTGRVMVYLP